MMILAIIEPSGPQLSDIQVAQWDIWSGKAQKVSDENCCEVIQLEIQ